LIIISILFGFHIYKHYKYNNNNEILQLNNFNKDLYEDYIGLKQPMIIMNTLTEIDLFEKLHIDALKKKNISFLYSNNINNNNTKKINITDNKDMFIFEDRIQAPTILTKEYYHFTKPLLSNISIWNTDYLTLFKKDMISPIVKSKYSRNLYMLFDGELLFTIYPPKYNEYMYTARETGHYTISHIHPKKILEDSEKEKYPLFSKSFSIDIIMRPGQILSIPPHWWYHYECKDDCILVCNKSDTIFTRMVNMI
tara:strand:- start:8011 stop:8769 length:759 start_codon:yes stop_codon:yes gene_type:complete